MEPPSVGFPKNFQVFQHKALVFPNTGTDNNLLLVASKSLGGGINIDEGGKLRNWCGVVEVQLIKLKS